MADFTQQQEFKTKESRIPVDNTLKPGVYIFQLVVVDQDGNASKPVQIKVVVVKE